MDLRNVGGTPGGTKMFLLGLIMAIAGGYLYAINPNVGQVTAYRIGDNGSLTALPAASGLPTGLAGLAAT